MRTLGVHHLAIQVADLPRVEAFYRDLLGLAVVRRWPAAGEAGERSVWLGTGDGSFLALERGGAGPPEGPPVPGDAGRIGLHLVALRIEPAERSLWEERLAAAGVPVTRRTAHTIYVRDPEGNRVGLSHWPDGVDHV